MKREYKMVNFEQSILRLTRKMNTAANYLTRLFRINLKSLFVLHRYKKFLPKLGLGLGISLASTTTTRFAIFGSVLNEEDILTVTRPDKPLDVIEPSILSHKFLIQQACAVAIDSSTRVLTQTFLVISTAHEQYKVTLEKLIYILELAKKVDQGGSRGVPVVEDALIQLRSNVHNQAAALSDAKLLYEYAARLLSAAADTAFLSGSETISLLATDRLNSSNREVAQLKSEIEALEKTYLLLQQEFIKTPSE